MWGFGIEKIFSPTGQTAPTSETKATLTRQTAITFVAKSRGTAGHVVTIGAKAAPDDTLALTVSENAITINLANTTTTKNTMTLIAALILATPAAAALVYPVVLTGATEMTNFAAVNLSGGDCGTPGAFNQVIQSTDGTKWTQISPYADCYYWAPDGFPAVNTEYIHCFDGVNGIIYKKKMTGTTAAAASTTVAHGVFNWNRPFFPFCSGAILSAAGAMWATGGYASAASSQLHTFGVANFVIAHGTSYQGQTYIESLYYSKTF